MKYNERQERAERCIHAIPSSVFTPQNALYSPQVIVIKTKPRPAILITLMLLLLTFLFAASAGALTPAPVGSAQEGQAQYQMLAAAPAGKDTTGEVLDTSPEASSGALDARTNLTIDIALVGTVLVDGKGSATIVEMNTGQSRVYKRGDKVVGAVITGIFDDRVEFEKDGEKIVLKVRGVDTTGTKVPATGGDGGDAVKTGTGELPPIEPMVRGSGPRADNIATDELPRFDPVADAPAPSEEGLDGQAPLPDFKPFESKDGPGGK